MVVLTQNSAITSFKAIALGRPYVFMTDKHKIIIGKFGKVYGIKGWLRVISYANPPANILNYSPWWIKRGNTWEIIPIANTKLHGAEIIAQPENCTDRDTAQTLTNLEIGIAKEQLPSLAPGEYYWHQLEGLTVIDQHGATLGVVDHLVATGANDVLIISNDKQQLLLPYIDEVVLKVDLKTKTITVNYEL